MDEHSTDDDLRSLRATDPAAGVEAPRELRMRVTGIPEQAGSGGEAEADPVPLPRRRRWLAPAAAAVAVVAAIGGGYVWGAGGIDVVSPTQPPVPLAVATGTPENPAAPVALDGSVETTADSQSVPGRNTLSGGVNAPGATDGLSTGADLLFGWGQPFGRQRFILPALETTPAQASVYAVDGRAQFSAEDAARMAVALGVAGDVRELEQGDGWVVGDPLSGPRLFLTAQAGDATYYSGLSHPWEACVNTASDAERQQCLAEIALPTHEQAREELRRFLTATGVDEDATHITVSQSHKEERTLTATAAMVVANNATEVVTQVQVSAQGIIYGSGPTGRAVSLGQYRIVSPADGAARLNDPAYSPRLLSAPEIDPTPGDPYTPPTDPPELPDAGSDVPWHIAQREIVSARLGLALLLGPNGVQYLAPAYEFTAADETVWSVIALEEDDLDTATAPGSYGGWW